MGATFCHDRDMASVGRHNGDDGGDGTAVLRERQQRLTRELILQAVADQLQSGNLADITVTDVARQAGMSSRTVYRYFATREELFAAAADWIGETYFGDPAFPARLEDLTPYFRRHLQAFDRHPNLVRAMAVTRAGNLVRSSRRRRRLAAMREALAEVTDHLPQAERRRAEAMFGYLQNMLAWVVMRDENGLAGDEVADTIGWATRVLTDDLRRRNEAAGAGRGKAASKQERSDGARASHHPWTR